MPDSIDAIYERLASGGSAPAAPGPAPMDIDSIYAQLAGRRPAIATPPPAMPDDQATAAANLKYRGELPRGLARGIDQMQGTLYGAGAMAASALGATGVRDWAIRGYQEQERQAALNPSSVPGGFTEAIQSPSKLPAWALGTIGELAPSMAEAAATSAIGAAIGSAMAPGAGTAGGAAAGLVGKQGVKELLKAGIRKIVGTTAARGAKAGMFAGVFPMEAGGNYAETFTQQGVDAPIPAMLTGGVAAAIELLGGNAVLIDKFLGPAGGQAFKEALQAGKLRAAAYIFKQASRQGGEEFLQESAQEALSVANSVLADPELSGIPDGTWERLFNAGMAGALGGGVGGVAGLAGDFREAQGQLKGAAVEKRAVDLMQTAEAPDPQVAPVGAGGEAFDMLDPYVPPAVPSALKKPVTDAGPPRYNQRIEAILDEYEAELGGTIDPTQEVRGIYYPEVMPPLAAETPPPTGALGQRLLMPPPLEPPGPRQWGSPMPPYVPPGPGPELPPGMFPQSSPKPPTRPPNDGSGGGPGMVAPALPNRAQLPPSVPVSSTPAGTSVTVPPALPSSVEVPARPVGAEKAQAPDQSPDATKKVWPLIEKAMASGGLDGDGFVDITDDWKQMSPQERQDAVARGLHVETNRQGDRALGTVSHSARQSRFRDAVLKKQQERVAAVPSSPYASQTVEQLRKLAKKRKLAMPKPPTKTKLIELLEREDRVAADMAVEKAKRDEERRRNATMGKVVGKDVTPIVARIMHGGTGQGIRASRTAGDKRKFTGKMTEGHEDYYSQVPLRYRRKDGQTLDQWLRDLTQPWGKEPALLPADATIDDLVRALQGQQVRPVYENPMGPYYYDMAKEEQERQGQPTQEDTPADVEQDVTADEFNDENPKPPATEREWITASRLFPGDTFMQNGEKYTAQEGGDMELILQDGETIRVNLEGEEQIWIDKGSVVTADGRDFYAETQPGDFLDGLDEPVVEEKTEPPETPVKIASVSDAFKEFMRGRGPAMGEVTADDKRDWLMEHGVVSDETGHRLRYVFTLSDGRKVSADSALKATNPALYQRLKDKFKTFASQKAQAAIFDALPSETQQAMIDDLPYAEIAAIDPKDSRESLRRYLESTGHPMALSSGDARNTAAQRVDSIRVANAFATDSYDTAFDQYAKANNVNPRTIKVLTKGGKFFGQSFSSRIDALVRYDGWTVAEAPAPPAMTNEERQRLVTERQKYEGARLNAERQLMDAGVSGREVQRAVTKFSGKDSGDDWMMTRFSLSRYDAHDIGNELTHFNLKADRSADPSDFTDAVWYAPWKEAMERAQKPVSPPQAPAQPESQPPAQLQPTATQAAAKEPWQMRVADYEAGSIIPAELYHLQKTPAGATIYVERTSDGAYSVSQSAASTKKRMPLATQVDAVAARDAAMRANGNRLLSDGKATADLIRAHRSAVEQALAAGKPVPAAVLADYPDLQKKPIIASKAITAKQAPDASIPATDETAASPMDRLALAAREYNWRAENNALYNRAGTHVHDIKVKGGRILLTDPNSSKVRGTLPVSRPDLLGKYLEGSFYAQKGDTSPIIRPRGEAAPQAASLDVPADPMAKVRQDANSFLDTVPQHKNPAGKAQLAENLARSQMAALAKRIENKAITPKAAAEEYGKILERLERLAASKKKPAQKQEEMLPGTGDERSQDMFEQAAAEVEPVAEPPVAKPAEKAAAAVAKPPLSKAKTHSAMQLHMAATRIREAAEKYASRISDKQKRIIENAMGTIRTHAPKFDIEVPSVGNIFNVEAYQSAVDAVLKGLPAWEDTWRYDQFYKGNTEPFLTQQGASIDAELDAAPFQQRSPFMDMGPTKEGDRLSVTLGELPQSPETVADIAKLRDGALPFVMDINMDQAVSEIELAIRHGEDALARLQSVADGEQARLTDQLPAAEAWLGRVREVQSAFYRLSRKVVAQVQSEIAARPAKKPAAKPAVEPIEAEREPLRYNPQGDRHNGRRMARGDLLTDDDGNTYRLDRNSGFMLAVDRLNDKGQPAGIYSFSVDPSDKERYKSLYFTGKNAYDAELDALDAAEDVEPDEADMAEVAEEEQPFPHRVDADAALVEAKTAAEIAVIMRRVPKDKVWSKKFIRDAIARAEELEGMDQNEYSLTAWHGAIAKPPLTAASIKSAFPNLPADVQVVDTEDDLPSRVRKPEYKGRIQAVYDPRSGQTFIVATAFTSSEQVARKIVHETIGHKGLEAALGNEIGTVLTEIANSVGNRKLRGIAGEYQYDLTKTGDRRKAAGEYVARMAERLDLNHPPAWWKRLTSAIRRWVRKMFPGMNLRWSDSDIQALLHYAAMRRSEATVKESLTTGGVMGTAPAFMLGGRKAKGIGQPAEADRMEAEGRSREDIWQETGWWRGADWQWRFEVDDRNLTFRGKARTGRLGTVIDHPEAFAAYPDLRDVGIEVVIDPSIKQGHGTFRGGDENSIVVGAPDERTALSVIAHEMQHWIQVKEGFALGANEDTYRVKGLVGVTRNVSTTLLNAERMLSIGKKQWMQYVREQPGVDRFADEIEVLEWLEANLDSNETARDIYDEWVYLEEKVNNAPETPEEAYFAAPGEIEARLVQRRIDMRRGERATEPPWETERKMLEEEGSRFSLGASEAAGVAEVRDAEGRLLAPNGKPSKLNELQWKQVRTPSFKRWFGDWQHDPANASKVVDENGEPMVVYHRTKADFTSFDMSKYRGGDVAGMYFTGEASTPTAVTYGDAPAGERIMSVFLRFKNPASVEDKARLVGQLGKDWSPAEMADAMKSEGFDGFADTDYRDAEYVVFSPTQIKSATGNVGTFDPANADIRYSLAGDRNIDDMLADARTNGMKPTEDMPDGMKWYQQLRQGVDKYLGVASTVLYNISPDLRRVMRDMYFNIERQDLKDLKPIHDLQDAMKKLRRQKQMTTLDMEAFYWLVQNGSDEALAAVDRMLEEFPSLRKPYDEARAMFDSIHDRLKAAGVDVPYRKNYWPRRIKDLRGLISYLEGNNEWSWISRALRAKMAELGNDYQMTNEETAFAIDMLLRGYMLSDERIGLGRPSNAKERRIDVLPPEVYAKYYHSANVSAFHYITDANKLLAWRELTGKADPQYEKAIKQRQGWQKARNQAREQLAMAQALALSANTPAKQRDEASRRVKKLTKTIARLTDKIENGPKPRTMQDHIGAYVDKLVADKQIGYRQEEELRSVLQALYRDHRPSGIGAIYRNLAYIDAMGQYSSAVTQIQDLAWSLHRNGILLTGMALGKAIVRQSAIKREDVTRDIAEETRSDDWAAKILDMTFRLTGLHYVDKIGKEALMNASVYKARQIIDRAKKGDQEAFMAVKKRLMEVFGDAWVSAMNDLGSDTVTENVLRFAFDELSIYQPLTQLEVPVGYLNGGNLRLLYMLKTFTIKQIDIYRTQVWHEYRDGDKKKAIRNLISLAVYLTLLGATADAIKDLLYGREIKPEDIIGDSVLKLTGLNRWNLMQARRYGPQEAVYKLLTPPHKMLDNLAKDIINGVDPNKEAKGQTINSLPLVGALFYWHLGGGTEKEANR